MGSIQNNIGQMQAQFSQFNQWEDRYRFIMKSGKNLAPYPADKLNDDYLIDGCESRVWLNWKIQDNKLFIQATSEARIVKGLLWILITPIDQQPLTEIAELDLAAYFQSLGLTKHLSPSRGNGLLTIAKHIQQIAQQA
ncbi:Fe-S metabolism protein SufE [Saccharobesus litoralis]|uniref:Fe-S metabolism protein SufE n=1 Tax=Saccharobesus litoralis TaxID=2172099 RepID=A0A2S0VLY2_9ALTE|nr:SufE family protein [Saccharobesus litoralis]AWB65227.1 Fe-S metabolism protein SufE [Saccharobesus litoralis]